MADYSNDLNVLGRFDAAFPGEPFPQDGKQFLQANVTRSQELQQSDPELHSLLAGTASAGLHAQVIAGTFSRTVPDYQAEQERAQRAEVQRLYAGFADLPLMERMKLAAMDPAVFAKAERENTPAGSEHDQLRGAQEAEARREAARASLNRIPTRRYF